jgi:N-sulfoglucosamine sulfohydrolase
METAMIFPESRRPRCPWRRSPFAAVAVTVSLIVFTVGCAVLRPAPAPPPRPNIFLIISDDQSWSPTSRVGDPVTLTPAIDRLARDGVVFSNAFVACPSCSPSRAAILTGQAIWRLGPAANQGGPLDAGIIVYPDLLEIEGYKVGFTGKGWEPGRLELTHRSRNPAGRMYNEFGRWNEVANFEAFLDSVPRGTPFCFWWGSREPHRPFVSPEAPSGDSQLPIEVPPVWPNVPAVAGDVSRYLGAVQQFDNEVGRAVEILASRGLLDNTLIVVTSDNGMSFPCGKANLYDRGTHVPLVIWWKGQVLGGRVVDDFVDLTDLAPTFLEAAGGKPPREMTGSSLIRILKSAKTGRVEPDRDFVVTARERHADCRPGSVGYPSRALRVYDYLYIRNYAPDRWPAGDPPTFCDIDSWNMSYSAPTKDYMMEHRDEPDVKPLFDRCFEKRPAEELYDLRADSYEMTNVLVASSGGARGSPADYEKIRKQLAERLEKYLKQTGDPRATGKEPPWDTAPPELP